MITFSRSRTVAPCCSEANNPIRPTVLDTAHFFHVPYFLNNVRMQEDIEVGFLLKHSEDSYECGNIGIVMLMRSFRWYI
jgi:hypothetical protein